jgi:hypothetical protein
MATEIDLNFNNGPDPQDDYNSADTYYKPSNIPSRIESANPDLTRKVLEFVSQQKRTKPEDLRTIVGPDAMRQRAFFEQMVKERIIDPLGRTLVKQVESIKVAPLSPIKLQENLGQGIVDYQQAFKEKQRITPVQREMAFHEYQAAKDEAAWMPPKQSDRWAEIKRGMNLQQYAPNEEPKAEDVVTRKKIQATKPSSLVEIEEERKAVLRRKEGRLEASSQDMYKYREANLRPKVRKPFKGQKPSGWDSVEEQLSNEYEFIHANDPKGPEFGPSTIAIGQSVKDRNEQRRLAANRQSALNQFKADEAAKDPVAEAEKMLTDLYPALEGRDVPEKFIQDFADRGRQEFLANIEKQAEDAKKKAQQDYKNYLQTRTKEYNTRSRKLQEAEIDIRNNRYESSRVRGLDILGPLISETGIQDSNKALEAIRAEGYKLKDSFNEDKFNARERRDAQLEAIKRNTKELKGVEWQPSPEERQALTFSSLLRSPDFFGNDPASIKHTQATQKRVREAFRALPEDHPLRKSLQTEILTYHDAAVPAQSMGPGSPIGEYRSDTPPVHNPIVTHPNWNQHVGNTIHTLGSNSGNYQGPNSTPPVIKNPSNWNNFTPSTATFTGIGAAAAASKAIQHQFDTLTTAHLFHSAGAKDFINDETKVLGDFAEKTLNPTGMHVGAGAVVSVLRESFAVLQSIDKGVDSMAKDVKPFAPETIQQDILNQIDQLQQNIRLGEELDPLLAAYSAARNDFQMAWNEVRADILQDLVPIAIDVMKDVKVLLPAIEMHVRVLGTALSVFPRFVAWHYEKIQGILEALGLIEENTKPDPMGGLDNQVLENINKFFNLNQPLNNAQKPKKVI